MSEIVTIQDVSQVHKSLGLEPPKHPLITVISTKAVEDYAAFTNVNIVNNL